MPDHVPMLISIPPKYAVSQVIGYIKGKSAIYLARVYGERKRNFVGQHFWVVSLSFRDEISHFSDRLAFSMEIMVPSRKSAWTGKPCIVRTGGAPITENLLKWAVSTQW